MIFDDHDLRDDFNTSASWREQMEKVEWWPRRVTSGLGAYWIYQHLGNMSPRGALVGRAARQTVHDGGRRGRGPRHVRQARLRRPRGQPVELLPRPRRHPPAHARLPVRAAAHPRRSADARPGGVGVAHRGAQEGGRGAFCDRHVGAVPAPSGIHHIESWNEALAQGAWGRRTARWSEKIRQAVDLEHWAAFRRSFEDLSTLLAGVGKPVMLLSGDVHYSYVAKADELPIYQLVCSPIRNPLSRTLRRGQHHRPVRRRDPDRTLALPDGQDPQASVQVADHQRPVVLQRGGHPVPGQTAPCPSAGDTAAGNERLGDHQVELKKVSGRNQETGTLQRGGPVVAAHRAPPLRTTG